jgi:hypothetical protein
MVTVIWAAAAAVIIMDGAEDAVIITAGHAVDITITVIDIPSRRPCSGGLLKYVWTSPQW